MRPASRTVVAGIDDLKALLRRRALVYQGPVVLAIEGLSGPERTRWQSRVNRSITACGCAEGSVAAVAALVAYLVARVTSGAPPSPWTVEVATGFGVFCLAAFAGKLLGLARARASLAATIWALEASLNSRRGRMSATAPSLQSLAPPG